MYNATMAAENGDGKGASLEVCVSPEEFRRNVDGSMRALDPILLEVKADHDYIMIVLSPEQSAMLAGLLAAGAAYSGLHANQRTVA